MGWAGWARGGLRYESKGNTCFAHTACAKRPRRPTGEVPNPRPTTRDCTRPGAKTLMLPQWGQPAARRPPWEQKHTALCLGIRAAGGRRTGGTSGWLCLKFHRRPQRGGRPHGALPQRKEVANSEALTKMLGSCCPPLVASHRDGFLITLAGRTAAEPWRRRGVWV